MDIENVIARNRENIRQAIEDYRRHTRSTEVLDDVSEAFINQLARDNAYAKADLRQLFSQSPVWDEELDALIINGTRTHDPDPERIRSLALEILDSPRAYADYQKRVYIDHAIRFFMHPNEPDMEELPYIAALAPKAYAPGRKLSRVFLALCKELGCADESKGSEFQKLYAQFADELSTRKIPFKLFVSVNPGHFLTMSNPKNDRRGNTLTSCHSFNVTDYDYNNGCSGYARDEVSFIAFTVADPADAETLNNRKTTRQIFAYRPGGGLLLQSRMYNTSGGVYGAAADAKLYRDLVQREISALEGAVNLWKTHHSYDPYYADLVPVADGFGGYADWTYEDFDCHVSIRYDHIDEDDEPDVRPMYIGAPGLCIVCGEENSTGLYCDDCQNGGYVCDDCNERFSDDDDLYTVYDAHGNERQVCADCRDRFYTYCDECDEYYPNECVTEVASGDYVCDECRERYYEQCEDCGEWHRRDNMTQVYDQTGQRVWVCDECLDNYYCCDVCGEYHHCDTVGHAYNESGAEVWVCDDCLDGFEECPHCGEMVKVSEDGTCPHCGVVLREDDSESEKEDNVA